MEFLSDPVFNHLFLVIYIKYSLTHWGRVTHICVSKLSIIGWDNGLSANQRQAIIWTNAGILLIGTLRTNFNEILIEFIHFHERISIWKCHLENGVHFVSASICYGSFKLYSLFIFLFFTVWDKLIPEVNMISNYAHVCRISLWQIFSDTYLDVFSACDGALDISLSSVVIWHYDNVVHQSSNLDILISKSSYIWDLDFWNSTTIIIIIL